MSTKILRTISMQLTPSSVNKAIREVKKFQEDLKRSCWELVQQLTMEGCEIAKMQITSLDAVDTGELEQSVYGLFFPSERCGFVCAGAPYAIYVEYGTGIVGSDKRHPEAAGKYDYDVNHHGNKGWVYKSDKDGHYYWTRGYIPRPFMYNTLKWLEEAAEREGIRMFRSYGK